MSATSVQRVLPSRSTKTKQRIKVLLIIDNLSVGAGLKILLESNPELKVEEARRADSTLATASKKPDVIILVVDHFPDLTLIDDLLTASENSRVLAFIYPDDNYLKLSAIKYGAKGVLTLEDDPAMLFAAITALHSHKVFISPVISHIFFFDRRDLVDEKLTPREHEIIVCVCQGLLNKQIARKLRVSEPTVKHHLRAIFEKLYVSNRAELVAYAFRSGIMRSHAFPPDR